GLRAELARLPAQPEHFLAGAGLFTLQAAQGLGLVQRVGFPRAFVARQPVQALLEQLELRRELRSAAANRLELGAPRAQPCVEVLQLVPRALDLGVQAADLAVGLEGAL